METLWRLSSLGRVCNCRRVAQGENTIVGIRRREGSASVSGVQTCGSVWACPMCGSRIRTERVEEITAALTGLVDEGGAIDLLTITVPHQRYERLEAVQSRLTGVWGAIRADRTCKRLRELADDQGYVRGLDHTHGRNGWHPHHHAHQAYAAPIDAGHREHLRQAMTAAANRYLARQDDAPGLLDPEHGITLQPMDLHEAVAAAAGYLTKPGTTSESAALEVAGGRGKRGRDGHRTPWEILADLTDGQEAADLALWREYEQATHGAHQLSWGGTLRDRCLVPHRTDEELAADVDDEGECVVETTASTYRRVTDRHGWIRELLMVAAQDADLDAVRDDVRLWFWARRLPPPTLPPDRDR